MKKIQVVDPPPLPQTSLTQELERLHDLLVRAAISQVEFDGLKAKLLGSTSSPSEGAPSSKLEPSRETFHMTNWTIAAFTHRGRVRPDNEDAIAIGNRIFTGEMDAPVVMTTPNGCCLLMIADGMGGHAHGARASRAVLDYLVAAIGRLSNPACCTEVIEEANQHLFKLMHEHEEALGMGTTLVGAVLKADQLITFNVGDSRCYLVSAGKLMQLSHDDVPESENNHFGLRRSHTVTQALGGSSFPLAMDPHIIVEAPLAPRETLLLCSDGLTDMVANQIISYTLRTAKDPLQSARELAAKAFSAGAKDNVSLIVARRTDAPGATANPPHSPVP